MFLPPSHISDALTLEGADGLVDLYELTPSIGTGTLHFKADNDVEWLGVVYTGVPMQMSGESNAAEGGNGDPQMTIGQPDIDLSMFKPLIRTGALDNAIITRKTVLLTDILANNDIKVTRTYRVGVVQRYSRSNINLLLRRFSAAKRVQLPVRQFLPPAFPYLVV